MNKELEEAKRLMSTSVWEDHDTIAKLQKQIAELKAELGKQEDLNEQLEQQLEQALKK